MEDSKYIILLVDDDENDVMLMRMAFEKSNLPNTIQWAKDGAEAVAYLNGEDAYANRQLYPFPEVLILDLKMPRMTGMELLAWIRDHPEYRVIPTIILTSSRLDDDIQKAYNLGANTYMIKPASLGRLGENGQSGVRLLGFECEAEDESTHYFLICAAAIRITLFS